MVSLAEIREEIDKIVSNLKARGHPPNVVAAIALGLETLYGIMEMRVAARGPGASLDALEEAYKRGESRLDAAQDSAKGTSDA